MPYQLLLLSPDTPQKVEAVVRSQVEPLLAAVHAMLCLPQKETLGLESDCTLAAALTLLAVVSGVSTEVLYAPGVDKKNDGGKRFMLVLEKFYPWEFDRDITGSIVDKHASNLLYEAFRNPLAHRLGGYDGPYLGDIKVLKGLLEDDALEEIERSSVPPLPFNRPTLYTDSLTKENRTKTILSLKRFYWGIRVMICNSLTVHTMDPLLKSQSADEFVRGTLSSTATTTFAPTKPDDE